MLPRGTLGFQRLERSPELQAAEYRARWSLARRCRCGWLLVCCSCPRWRTLGSTSTMVPACCGICELRCSEKGKRSQHTKHRAKHAWHCCKALKPPFSTLTLSLIALADVLMSSDLIVGLRMAQSRREAKVRRVHSRRQPMTATILRQKRRSVQRESRAQCRLE